MPQWDNGVSSSVGELVKFLKQTAVSELRVVSGGKLFVSLP